jgi:cell division protein FtsB
VPRKTNIGRAQALWERARALGPMGFVYAAAAAALLIAALPLFDAHGLRRLRLLQADSARQSAANDALRAQNSALLRTIQQLGDPADPKSLERAAREQLGFIKPDEIVFKFE